MVQYTPDPQQFFVSQPRAFMIAFPDVPIQSHTLDGKERSQIGNKTLRAKHQANVM